MPKCQFSKISQFNPGEPIQVDMGGGYNRNSVRVLLLEVSREHGQAGVDQLNHEFSLDEKFGMQPGQAIQT